MVAKIKSKNCTNPSPDALEQAKVRATSCEQNVLRAGWDLPQHKNPVVTRYR